MASKQSKKNAEQINDAVINIILKDAYVIGASLIVDHEETHDIKDISLKSAQRQQIEPISSDVDICVVDRRKKSLPLLERIRRSSSSSNDKRAESRKSSCPDGVLTKGVDKLSSQSPCIRRRVSENNSQSRTRRECLILYDDTTPTKSRSNINSLKVSAEIGLF